MKRILIMIIILANCPYLLASLQNSYNSGKAHQNKLQLGNPDNTTSLINPKSDTKNLQNLNDTSLESQGKHQLNSTEAGKFIRNSEFTKNNSKSKFKINSNNQMLKNSLKIENNPLARSGASGSLRNQVSTVKTTVHKTCYEGVEFDIDIGREYIYDCSLLDKEKWGRWQPRSMVFDGCFITWHRYHWFNEVEWKRDRKRHKEWELLLRVDDDAKRQYKSEIARRLNVKEDHLKIGHFHDRGEGGGLVGSSQHNKFMAPRYRIHYYYRDKIKYKEFKRNGEYWQITTPGTEELSNYNECYETSRKCLKSGTKVFFDKYKITKPCWQEQISYHCQSDPIDGCDYLNNKNCILQNSECVKYAGSICLKWKRHYKCPAIRKQVTSYGINSPIYCISGNCLKEELEANQDIGNVAYLAALNEAKNDCNKGSNGACLQPIEVFKGYPKFCRKSVKSFLNCCTSMKGWGKDLKLAKCKPTESELALKRGKGLCHFIGSYCSQRDPILRRKCLERKSSYCCYKSKLARIFQEQARKQLNKDFGSSEYPNCKGLSIDQLSKLDYSKFDLNELFDGLMEDAKANMTKSFGDDLKNEMPQIQKDHMDSSTRNGGM